jgi:RimJ/RimL family protein N-acetyltransferase
MGYILCEDARGKGYMTEAVRGLLDFGFKARMLHRIWATCDVRNTPSRRVMEKCGLKREGKLRDDQWQKGEWRTMYIYAKISK